MDFGMEVDMERNNGVWSDVGFALGESEVSGKVVVWARLTSARSRIGGSWPLDQVKLRPSSGISITPKELMVSLKVFIRGMLTLTLFFSSPDRIRLKSPMMTQGPLILEDRS